MNDFSDLEKELRKLQPAQPSPMLFERVGEGLKNCRASVSDANGSDGVSQKRPIIGGR